MTTNRVTAQSISALNVSAFADDAVSKLANLTQFMASKTARQNAIALFVLTKRMALEALGLLHGEERARAVWDAMNWEERFAFLIEIDAFKKVSAEENPKEEVAKKAEDLMRGIVKSGSHRLFVDSGVEFVEDATRKAASFKELTGFLDEAWTKQQVRTSYYGEDAIILYAAGGARTYYGPATPVTEGAWPFVLEAWRLLCNTRDLLLAEKKNKAEELAEEATPDLTLTGIVDKQEEGKILVQLDHGRVALLHFFEVRENHARVEILETNHSTLKWRPILVELPSFQPMAGYWPNDSFGFRKTLQEQLQGERADQKLQEHLAPLRVPDLLPEELGHQSMRRILLGQAGSALAYHSEFRENESSIGFLGVTISQQNGKFVLAAVESDSPFPQDLVGKELPLYVENTGSENKPYITVDLQNVPEEHRRALDRIKRLLVLRIGLEHKYYTRR